VRWRFLTSWPAAVLLLTLHWVLAVWSAADKSLTYDESMHLTGGHAAWARGDYRLNPGSGLLPQLWMALPTAMTDAQFTPEADPASWNDAAQTLPRSSRSPSTSSTTPATMPAGWCAPAAR
jgi:hypothetical protein